MRRLGAILVAAAIVATSAPAMAQPPVRPSGPTVADIGSVAYRFERFTVPSADGRTTYRIDLAVPRKGVSKGGYPVAYLLDGDLALARLDEPLLRQLGVGDAPVLVAIGYEGDRQVAVRERAYDYTPAPKGGGQTADPAGRPGGGADAFLDTMSQKIEPEVARRAPIDTRRSLLWGHSYGGLCTLHAALTRPDAYHAFVAASPSLWWNYGSVLEEVDPLLAQSAVKDLRLTILVGEDEVSGKGASRRTHPMWSAVPAGAAEDLAKRLSGAGADVRFAELPGQGHGGMLAASLVPTLLSLAGVAPAPGGVP